MKRLHTAHQSMAHQPTAHSIPAPTPLSAPNLMSAPHWERLLIGISLAGGLMLAGCTADVPHRATAAEKEGKMPTVLVALPQQKTFDGEAELASSVVANQDVKIYAMVAGYLESISVDIGTSVAAGQAMARLANPELLQRQKKALADFLLAKTTYERLSSTYKQTPDLLSLRDVEKAKAEFDGADAVLKGYNESISYLTIRAPFSGVITRRFLDKGATVQSGSSSPNAVPIVEVMDISTVRVEVDVPETDAPLVKEKNAVVVTFPELPSVTLSAAVSRIAYALKPESKTMRAEIDLPNRDKKIRPGMSAVVKMKLSTHPDALAVPTEAVMTSKGQSYIYKVSAGKVQKVDVRLGFRDTRYAEVLPGSIAATDSIVVRGKELVAEGEAVDAKHE